MRTRLLLPHVAALLLATHFVSAQPPASAPAPATETGTRRATYQQATDALRAKNWPEAERLFKQLWLEHPTYDVGIGLGQSELLQKKYRDAAEHLAFGVRNFPPREKPEAVEVPKKALLAAKKYVAALQITVDQPNAEVAVDGVPVGKSPLDGDVFVEGGPHTIEARLSDTQSARQTIDAKVNQDQSVDLKFPEPDSSPAASPGTHPGPSKPPTETTAPVVGSGLNPDDGSANQGSSTTKWVVVGSGAALTAVAFTIGVGYALGANSKQSDVDRLKAQVQTELGGNCSAGSASSACGNLSRATADRNSDAQVARAAIITSGVLAIGTVATFLLWPASETSGHARITPTFDRSSAALTVQGAF